jgi:adenosylcobyric acid synthase
VLNKFRGDVSLLAPGPEKLRKLTGVPTVATLPMWWQHGLPEEDGVFDERSTNVGPSKTVTIVAYPRISNLDEFQPLKNLRDVRVLWARDPVALRGADWVILPGSKHTSADLAWMRAQGLDQAVRAHASAGRPLLGICGGLQMLGTGLKDAHGVDGTAEGLGLLPLTTEFKPAKTVRRRRARFASLSGPWAALSGLAVEGYEIHQGHTSPTSSKIAALSVMRENLAWQNAEGNILGFICMGCSKTPPS